ncbi:hypothetical protein E2562_036710 [Oryza meyeriana var. granulata]|uniref:Uncharacterized protein n=1 Tax=Oryza meyeriana var. granulata TaxID=110450 RepID=A0A6G1CLD3_9ORYZ|nr:hypothetical protein E2562_036710 [Oryza meyeriana var. granulata]
MDHDPFVFYKDEDDDLETFLHRIAWSPLHQYGLPLRAVVELPTMPSWSFFSTPLHHRHQDLHPYRHLARSSL